MANSVARERAPDPACWLKDHGDYLYSFAYLRLRDANLAEDAVQETLLSALRSRDRFRGKSRFRTWLTAILKNRIVEIFRDRARREKLEADVVLNRLFDENGKWRIRTIAWKNDPAAAFEYSEFWKVFTDCLNRLPDRMADVFTLRAFDDTEAEEVGVRLQLKKNHVLVLLHRARLRLWNCLSIKWFRTG